MRLPLTIKPCMAAATEQEVTCESPVGGRGTLNCVECEFTLADFLSESEFNRRFARKHIPNLGRPHRWCSRTLNPAEILVVARHPSRARLFYRQIPRTEIFPPPPTAQEKYRQHRRSPKECWRRLRDMRNKLPLMPPILSAWRTLLARFERAVLSGDALALDWLDRQLKALRSMQQQEKIQFNAKVVYLLEMAMYGTQANQGRRADQPRTKTNSELSKLIAQRKAEQAQLTPLEHAERIRKRDAAAKAYEAWLNTPEGRSEQDPIKRHEKFFGSQPASRSQQAKQRAHAASLRRHRAHVQDDLTLTPAGKFTDAMASDIYNAFEKRELPDGGLMVEGVMEAIHDLAKQLRFALRKQH
jgi:hypothetical protein